MTANKQTKLERFRAFMDKPYVKLSFVIIVFVAIGLGLVYVYLLIAVLYVLVTLIGNQNVQLLVGTISALGTVASALVAYLLYQNSVRGASIIIAIEDILPVKTHASSRNVDGEFYEEMILSFPILFSNSGARGGALTSLDIVMTKPAHTIPTVRDGVASTDRIEFYWNAGDLTWKPLAIKDNETVPITAGFDLRLKEKDSKNRPPTNHFVDIQKKEPYFVFKASYKVTNGKGRIVPRERFIQIRPEFDS